MEKILGIEVTDEEYDFLLCQQSKGKELKVVDGKVVAVDHEETEIEKLNNELNSLISWFNGYYDNQIKQYERCQRLGLVFDGDIKTLDNEAQNNQIRIREIREKLKSQ
jgi:hypothetical protein